MKSSPWDPKESLPREYARIVQPDNYPAVKASSRLLIQATWPGHVCHSAHHRGALDLVARQKAWPPHRSRWHVRARAKTNGTPRQHSARVKKCSNPFATLSRCSAAFGGGVRPVYMKMHSTATSTSLTGFCSLRGGHTCVRATDVWHERASVLFPEKEGTDAELIASGSLMALTLIASS